MCVNECACAYMHVCVFFLSFFCFAFPSYISGVHHFWVRFLCMRPFFNPTIKVVTHLGHERQDLLSPCDEMHVCTD